MFDSFPVRSLSSSFSFFNVLHGGYLHPKSSVASTVGLLVVPGMVVHSFRPCTRKPVYDSTGETDSVMDFFRMFHLYCAHFMDWAAEFILCLILGLLRSSMGQSAGSRRVPLIRQQAHVHEKRGPARRLEPGIRLAVPCPSHGWRCQGFPCLTIPSLQCVSGKASSFEQDLSKRAFALTSFSGASSDNEFKSILLVLDSPSSPHTLYMTGQRDRPEDSVNANQERPHQTQVYILHCRASSGARTC